MRRLVLLPALLAFLVGAVPALAWTWPVDGPVLQSFSLEGGPYAAGQHRGADIGGDDGAPVRAPTAGTVTFAGTVPAGGRSVTIETADGLAVTLLHLGAVLVAEGDVVSDGEGIGVVGWSGEAEHPVPSVHLGVRVAAEADGYLDPLLYLPPRVPNEQVVEGKTGAAPVAPPSEEEQTPPPAEAGPGPVFPEEADPPADAGTPLVDVEAVAPSDTEVAPLEPLTIVSGETAAPSAASAQPGHAASPESSGRSPDASPIVTEGAPTLPASESPAGSSVENSRSAKPSHLSEARSPGTTSEVVDDRRQRQRRSRPLASTTAAQSAGRSAHALDRGAASPVRRARAADGEEIGSARDPEGLVPSAAPVRTPAGDGWLWRATLAGILAVSALALITRRRGGGPAFADADLSPGVPPAVPAQAVGPADAPPATRPAVRRDSRVVSSREGRYLERGGPGAPAKRTRADVRGRHASV